MGNSRDNQKKREMRTEEEILEKNNCITDIGYGHGKQLKYGITIEKIIEAMQEYASEQCKAYKELLPISLKLIGEIIDNYEADAINLPAEMYNELKFHWKQLKQLINDKL